MGRGLGFTVRTDSMATSTTAGILTTATRGRCRIAANMLSRTFMPMKRAMAEAMWGMPATTGTQNTRQDLPGVAAGTDKFVYLV